MKRSYLFNLKRIAAIACLFVFAACGGNDPHVDETVPVTGVTLNKIELTLLEGATETLTADVLPEEATDKTVSWSIDKPGVASVENGLVTAIAEGTATITVTTRDGGHTAICELTVEKEIPDIRVTGVELNKNTTKLVKGVDETLIATVSPAEATNKNVVWSSSDPNVVFVNSEGKISVTAMEGGSATITAKTEDGGFEDHCVVTVAIPVIAVELNPRELALEKDATATLTATLMPGTATDQSVTWTSSDPNVATVAPDGPTCVVTAVAAGSATITVKTVDGGLEDHCAVTVTALHPVFGTISFRSATTKTVGNQIWSDVVMGSDCPTSGFESGYQSGPKVACRNVDGGYGTFFSWPAVDENKGILCPDGWRVPTAADFTALNTAIGGTLADYQSNWGAELGGSIWNGGYHATVGSQGKYWSQSAQGEEYAYYLHLQSSSVTPNQSAGKNYGHNLRCVKDAN